MLCPWFVKSLVTGIVSRFFQYSTVQMLSRTRSNNRLYDRPESISSPHPYYTFGLRYDLISTSGTRGSYVPPMYNTNTNSHVLSTLNQHASILSNMTVTLNMLQGNQDFLLDKLNDITTKLQQTQTTLSTFLQKQPVDLPSLAASSNSNTHSNSHSNSLPSDLSYTHDNFDHASSASTVAKQSTTADSSHADKSCIHKNTPTTQTIALPRVAGIKTFNLF
jgi:hypothetical protein